MICIKCGLNNPEVEVSCPGCGYRTGGGTKTHEPTQMLQQYQPSRVNTKTHEAKLFNSENYLNLAKTAYTSKNYDEAYSYYTKILEEDVENYQAWLGKGESAGWLSKLNNCRLGELNTCIQKAIDYAPQDKVEEIKKKSANSAYQITLGYYKLANSHYYKFYQVDEAKSQFINQIIQCLNCLYYTEVFLDDTFESLILCKKGILELQIAIAKDGNGLFFLTFFGKNPFPKIIEQSNIRKKQVELVLKGKK